MSDVLKYWIVGARPKTLSISLAPVLMGAAVAWYEAGDFSVPVLIATLLGALFIQAGTNLHNDAADHERGVDAVDDRLGPPRVTAEGWLSASTVRSGAMLSFAAAILVGCYLIVIGGWPILLVGLASIAAGWAYTGGRKPLGYSGLGELFVWIFFGLVAVSGSYFLQTGELSSIALLAGAAIGLPSAAVLVVNNYRDLETDKRVGKNTLAVRMGRDATKVEYSLLVLLPFAFLAFMATSLEANWFWLLTWVAIPWGVRLAWRFAHEPVGPGLNGLLLATARYQFGLGVLVSMSLVASTML